ncbi:hypothetical protein STIAU_3302 [Stigmatella aurantiaca DW4/3-1]|uniref:Uncharacterized protein n=1 Tax=Stigmatella aurantiaca (strain DW4/3-1) TaxID=378806 RepID=Q099P6_STIAD|nr:hypothetical protein STIAU_3302 [Stigmatella aurantiaca DW4/3-1]
MWVESLEACIIKHSEGIARAPFFGQDFLVGHVFIPGDVMKWARRERSLSGSSGRPWT